MFWVQNWVFEKKHLDRSASFFGQKSQEHVKTIKKRCLEAQNEIPHASRIPTSPQRATFMENEYGWFMRVYGMSFVSSEILKPEPRKHKKIKAQSSEVGTNYRPK